jgi:hypothetical protein
LTSCLYGWPDILIQVSITSKADSILYSFLRSSTKSLVSCFAIYSATEDISFSGSLFMRSINNPLLTVTNPANAITRPIARAKEAPIATSGNNVYIAWWNNKTGNDEVMFRASTDNGKIFGEKMNLSNTPNAESQDAEIAAAGNNVYVSWWERNQTSNEPVLRVSNDNGKTFGEKIMLSEK